MSLEGGCQCGAVRYRVDGEPKHVALCHCGDCRKSSGAPVMAWAGYEKSRFQLLDGTPASYSSNGAAVRNFCGVCGSGLYYINEQSLPGLVDIQVASLDDPGALMPRAHIQVAERIDWMKDISSLVEFERFPS